MESLFIDLRHSSRRLGLTPVFTTFAVVTLALGIGVTTTVYSVLRAVSAPPAGVQDVHAIVNVYQEMARRSRGSVRISWPDYQDFKARQTVFDSVTALQFFQLPVVANGHSETAWNEIVDGDYFRTLRVSALLGRTLQPADDLPSAPAVAVIGYQEWHRVFDAAPDVLGRLVRMNGHNFEVIGVAPQTFSGLGFNGLLPTSVWVSLSAAPLLPNLGKSIDRSDREKRGVLVKGRLRQGRTLLEAQAEVSRIASQLDTEFPKGSTFRLARPWGVRRADAVVLDEGVDHFLPYLLWVIAIAVSLILLVVCTNLANLTLARSGGRQHEQAVRLALGASRFRLVREALTETGMIAVVGGFAGVGMARVLLTTVGSDFMISGASLHVEPVLDYIVLAGATTATTFAVLIAGLVPALQSTRVDVRNALGAEGAAAIPRWRGRRVLIAAQATVSVVLLAVATVCLDRVRQDSINNTGIDLEHLAVVQVELESQGYDHARAQRAIDTVLDEVAHHSQVEGTAASTGLPVSVDPPLGVLSRNDGLTGYHVKMIASTPGLLRVLGIPVLRGRAIDGRDTASSESTVVLSEQVAKALFGTVDPIARPVLLQSNGEASRSLTVVGVASNTNAGAMDRQYDGIAYLPLDQGYTGRLTVAGRSSGDPTTLLGAMQTAFRRVDPDLALISSVTGPQMAGPNPVVRLTGRIASALGSFALLIVLVGLYGVVSQIMTRRTKEIGVRLALGAGGWRIVRMGLVDGLRPVLFGIATGVTGGVLARMAMRPLFDKLLPAVDPLAFGIAPVFMLIAAAVACYLPARRAARLDPNVALRDL